jgi:uncharacterized protein (TIGR00252 family)
MKTTSIGKSAEQVAADHLLAKGFQVLTRNWRTRVCEIDVIAKKDGVIYFVEVKYRRRSNQGDGLAYITAKKLKQMTYAAEIWVQENSWTGDWRLVAAAIDGEDYGLVNIVEIS